MRPSIAVVVGLLIIAGCSTGPSLPLADRINNAQRITDQISRDSEYRKLSLEAADARMLDLTMQALDSIADNYVHDQTTLASMRKFAADNSYSAEMVLADNLRRPDLRQSEIERIHAERATGG